MADRESKERPQTEAQSDVQQARRASSGETLNGPQDDDKQKSEKQDGEGEEKGEESIPKPVGFFDPRLHKTRIEVAWKWVVTSR